MKSTKDRLRVFTQLVFFVWPARIRCSLSGALVPASGAITFKEFLEMKMPVILPILLVCLGFTFSSIPASAQSGAGAGTSSSQQQSAPPPQEQSGQPSMMSPRAVNVRPGQPYQRPTEKDKLRGYIFDTFGPYPIISAVATAGIQQARNKPPDWGQGWDAYGVRVASNFGVNLVTQTTRYGLAEIFREDTLYYRCECTGIGRRLGHALISTVTARRGEDGHRTFSFSALAAPYAGTEAAALLWYPSRFDPSDGFRMGNINLAVQAAINVANEFIYGGPHTLLGQHHVPVISNVTGSSRQ